MLPELHHRRLGLGAPRKRDRGRKGRMWLSYHSRLPEHIVALNLEKDFNRLWVEVGCPYLRRTKQRGMEGLYS